MTSRITISVAHTAPKDILFTGGPTGIKTVLKPGDTRSLDVIDGFKYGIEEGQRATPVGPLVEADHGKPTLQGA